MNLSRNMSVIGIFLLRYDFQQFQVEYTAQRGINIHFNVLESIFDTLNDFCLSVLPLILE